jgi:hypothetical protein
MDFELYGDDAYVFLKNHPNVAKIDEIIKDLGIKGDPILPSLHSTSFIVDNDLMPDFLKRRITETGMVWNHKKMFDKFLYQSKKRGLDKQVELVISYHHTVPTDNDVYMFCEDFLEWVKCHPMYHTLSYETRTNISSFDRSSRHGDFIYGFKVNLKYRGLSEIVKLLSDDLSSWETDPGLLGMFDVKKYMPNINVLLALGFPLDELDQSSDKILYSTGVDPPGKDYRRYNDSASYWADQALLIESILKTRVEELGAKWPVLPASKNYQLILY